MTDPKLEDRKDPKSARVVLSKGHKLVRLGYSRVTGVAAKVTDKREKLGNHDRVNRVSKIEQHYPSRVTQNSNTDRQADWVSQATRVSPNSSMDRRTDQVSRVGNPKHKKGCSSHFANMEVQVTENSANTLSWVMENLANTESRATKNSANTENWVIQESGGKKLKEGKGAAPSKMPAPLWCPRGIMKIEKHRL
jgi:hypothetical protein